MEQRRGLEGCEWPSPLARLCSRIKFDPLASLREPFDLAQDRLLELARTFVIQLLFLG